MSNAFDHQQSVYLNLNTPLNYLKLKTDTLRLGEDVGM